MQAYQRSGILLRVAGVLAAGIPSTLLSAGAQEPLRYGYRAGEAFTVVQTQHMETSTTLDDRPLRTQLRTALHMTWEVTGFDAEGRAVLRQRIDRIAMQLTAPAFGTLAYDSAAPVVEGPAGEEETPPAGGEVSNASLSEALRPLVGAEFTRVVDPRGRVVSARFSEEARAALAASPARRLNDLLSEEGLAQLFRQTDVLLPEFRPAEGAAWDDRATLKSPFGPIEMTLRYRLLPAEERDDAGLLRFATEVECDYSQVGRDLGISMRAREQKSEGRVEFDRRAGHVRRLRRRHEIHLESTAAEQTTGQHITTEIEFTLTPRP